MSSHDCRTCDGRGWVGPVHINRGDKPHEWRDRMECFHCDGTGKWSDDRLSAWEDGQRARRERAERGESLREAARRMGISPSELSRRERGQS